LFAVLAKRLGIKVYAVSPGELEGSWLAKAMKKGSTGEYIDTHVFLKKLKGK